MVAAFVEVWQAIMTFFVSIFSNIQGVFWDTAANGGKGGLTFIGIMAIIMAGVALILLIIKLFKD